MTAGNNGRAHRSGVLADWIAAATRTRGSLRALENATGISERSLRNYRDGSEIPGAANRARLEQVLGAAFRRQLAAAEARDVGDAPAAEAATAVDDLEAARHRLDQAQRKLAREGAPLANGLVAARRTSGVRGRLASASVVAVAALAGLAAGHLTAAGPAPGAPGAGARTIEAPRERVPAPWRQPLRRPGGSRRDRRIRRREDEVCGTEVAL